MSDKEFDSNNASGEDKGFFDDELELELKNPVNIEVAVKIFVREEVINDILSYSKTDTSRELGGVLLGRYKEIDGKYKVLIEETVIAQHTEAGLSQITFTHETWEYIHHEMENKYPDLKMVGWFHTHPGFGVFLSEDDYFIHNNFFSKPWSVAYVLDPVRKQDGFFGWSNGNIVRIPDRHINDVLKKAEPEKQPAYISRANKTTAIQASIFQRIFRPFLIPLLALSLMANVYFVWHFNDFTFFIGTNDAEDVIEETNSNSATDIEGPVEPEEEPDDEVEAEVGSNEEEGTNNGNDPESNHD